MRAMVLFVGTMALVCAMAFVIGALDENDRDARFISGVIKR